MTETNNINKLKSQHTIDSIGKNNTNDFKKLNTEYSYDTTDNNNNNNTFEGFPSEKKSTKLITIGKCSKFYYYILGSAFFKFLYLMILGDINSNIGLFGFSPILSSYNSMQSIYTYLGYIIFGIISYFFFNSKKKGNKISLNTLEYIYEKIKNQDKNKTYLQIFLVCLCFIIYKEVQNLFYFFGYEALDYWSFEIIFTFLFMKRYFEIDIYKHHICSIIFNFTICSTLLFVASFFPCSKEGNQYKSVENKLGNYFYSIIFILVFLFLSFIYAFSRNFSKVLMQAKSVSSFILMIFIGVIGIVFTIVVSIILYYFEKEDNFIAYFKNLKIHTTWEIIRDVLIASPIYSICRFMQLYLEIITIYYLNPIYCLMLNNICYSIQKVAIYLIDIKMELFTYFILTELAEVFAAFGYTIYLEIIELNFCGLSDNIKRNIMLKAERDFNRINEDKIENILNNDDDDEKDGNEYIGLGKYEEMIEKRKKTNKS